MKRLDGRLGASILSILWPRYAVREGTPDYLRTYREVQQLEQFHSLAHHPALITLMQAVLGSTHVFPHPLKIARFLFPWAPEYATPEHQDYLNNQGTHNLTAAWVPLKETPRSAGGLSVYRGSHKLPVLPRTHHAGAGGTRCILPQRVDFKSDWHVADYEVGDVLLFPAHTVHRALPNKGHFLRLSVDFRYQREGEALTRNSLRPHYNVLKWKDVYANWTSRAHQYYWKSLSYKLEPLVSPPALRLQASSVQEQIERSIAVDNIVRSRFARRLQRAADTLALDVREQDVLDAAFETGI